MHFRFAAAAALALGLSSPALAQSVAVQVVSDCGGVSLPVTGGGRLFVDQQGKLCVQIPTAASGKIVSTVTALTATTSTTIAAANADRIAIEIQCDGTAAVGVSRSGATITSVATAGLIIPAGTYPLYTMPIASLTAVTAYTGTAQSCRVTEYVR